MIPVITRTCPKCGKEYQTKIAAPSPVCQDCGPAWDAEIERRLKIETTPDIEQSSEAMFDRQGVRPRYYAATLDNFIARTERESVVVKTCRSLERTARGTLILIGTPGTGKTHLLNAMVKDMGGRFFKMLEIGMFIRATFGDGGAKLDEQQALNYLCKLPMLAIDEIEKSKGTKAESDWLSYIIDERYSRNLPLAIAGNLHPRIIHGPNGKTCDDCFESCFRDADLDRLRQIGTMHYLDGTSHRPELKETRV